MTRPKILGAHTAMRGTLCKIATHESRGLSNTRLDQLNDAVIFGIDHTAQMARIFPGFMMLRGFKASLSRRITSTPSSPCLAVQVPRI